jgi:hypothetical protein
MRKQKPIVQFHGFPTDNNQWVLSENRLRMRCRPDYIGDGVNGRGLKEKGDSEEEHSFRITQISKARQKKSKRPF